MKNKPKNYDRRERIWNAWSHVLDVPSRIRAALSAAREAAGDVCEDLYYRLR